MTKYFIQTILFFIIGFSLLSCSSKNEASYDIEGFWVVNRSFESSDESLTKRVNNTLYPDYVPSTSKGEYMLFKGGEYEEGFIDVISGSGETEIVDYLPQLSGSYTYDNDNGTVNVNITNSAVGTWKYTLKVADINGQFMFLVQDMDNKDLATFMNTYFKSPSSYDASYSAKWNSSCFKSKK